MAYIKFKSNQIKSNQFIAILYSSILHNIQSHITSFGKHTHIINIIIIV